ncbi:M20 family metallopeptidase [Agromyces tropicus]|uniref:M20 family metallopeptidase n=1 Tax=Agromyces tropicus TaxID=555371 RepID=A0ABN2URM9_9MICO
MTTAADGDRGRLTSLATRRLASVLDDSRELIGCESPSSDRAAVARSAEVVAAIGSETIGVTGDIVVTGEATHVRFRFGRGRPRLLLVGHHDTVFPLGTLAARPWSVVDGLVRGPGCVDMKVGIAQGFHALAMLVGLGVDLDGVTFLLTGDEELGSLDSRPLIEAEARECAAVLVLEGSASGAAIKTGRKGTSRYTVEVAGRAAHAGVEPRKGANATVELATQILAVAALNEFGATTVTPTLVSGGTSRNTVPDRATLEVDVRAWTAAEQDRVDRAMRHLSPGDADCTVTVIGGPDRPPMEPGQAAGLFAIAQQVARREGLPDLREVSVGGASDGNFTAAIGVPTLDGLGAVGGDAHAAGEYVRLDAIVPRTALLAGLVEALVER